MLTIVVHEFRLGTDADFNCVPVWVGTHPVESFPNWEELNPALESLQKQNPLLSYAVVPTEINKSHKYKLPQGVKI